MSISAQVVARDELRVVRIGEVRDADVSCMVCCFEHARGERLATGGVHALSGWQVKHRDSGLLVSVESETLANAFVGFRAGGARGGDGVREAARGG
jgi:hypothetical protein